MCTSRRDDGQVQRLLEHDEREQRRPGCRRRSTSASPAGGVHDHAADERAADGGEGEGRADVAGVAAALARA